jgi:hypothetical protein
MARPKKEVVETTVKEKTTNKESELLSALSKQLEEMQARLDALAKENKELKEHAVEETETELNSDTEIPVVSLTVGKLVISTLGNGLGTVYRFEEFGQVQDIPFGDLKDIVKNKPKFAKGGAYYIANEEAVKKLRLTKDYENIIPDGMFETLLAQNPNVVVDAYKTAPKFQQEQVVSLIEEKLEHKAEIDANILMKIGKLCGKDFMRNDEE